MHSVSASGDGWMGYHLSPHHYIHYTKWLFKLHPSITEYPQGGQKLHISMLTRSFRLNWNRTLIVPSSNFHPISPISRSPESPSERFAEFPQINSFIWSQTVTDGTDKNTLHNTGPPHSRSLCPLWHGPAWEWMSFLDSMANISIYLRMHYVYSYNSGCFNYSMDTLVMLSPLTTGTVVPLAGGHTVHHWDRWYYR